METLRQFGMRRSADPLHSPPAACTRLRPAERSDRRERRGIAELPNTDVAPSPHEALEGNAEQLHLHDIAQAVAKTHMQRPWPGRICGICRDATLERAPVVRARHEVLQLRPLQATPLQRHQRREARGLAHDPEARVESHHDIAHQIQQIPQPGALATEHGRLQLPPHARLCVLRRNPAHSNHGDCRPCLEHNENSRELRPEAARADPEA
mmetsp:Transcript_106104/g.306966  ORF Transcript_106104/g.306966 Transcript_106104/m.306966 type:complete len:210 (+) Transcript_106104:527-1156(+)